MEETPIWITALLSLALFLSAAAAWRLRTRPGRQRRMPEEWPLLPRPVFSTEERRVHRQLCTALPNLVVLAKLPLVRFCQPVDARQLRYWYDLLGAVHVTFVVCTSGGRVLAAVDVDGDQASSRRAAQIKASVLAACRVRYLRCSPDRVPTIAELQALVPQPPVSASPASAALEVDRSRDRLASTVATRRQERVAAVPDPNAARDSGYGSENPYGRSDSDDIGGVVIDHPISPLRR